MMNILNYESLFILINNKYNKTVQNKKIFNVLLYKSNKKIFILSDEHLQQGNTSIKKYTSFPRCHYMISNKRSRFTFCIK